MPQYVDLQVNGFAGVDFNSDELTLDGLEHACAALRNHDVEEFFPTLITDDLPRMHDRIGRLVVLRAESAFAQHLITGIHLEGPFISPVGGFVGAHPVEHVRRAEIDAMKALVDAGQGLVKLVTLAPEQDSGSKVTAFLARSGIRVSAGHTDASLDQLQSAIDAGLSGFTHLGNACPMQMHRHDNIVQRVLSLRRQLSVSLIGDGWHLPTWLLKYLLEVLGVERTFLVTDAISAASLGPGIYRLGSRNIHIGEDGVARSEDRSHFVGSTTTMPRMDQILEQLQFDEPTRHQLLYQNAKKFMLLAR